MSNPNILEISVSEKVGLKDIGPGTPAPAAPQPIDVAVADQVETKEAPPGTQAPTQQQLDENLPKDEFEKRQKIMLEYTRLSGRYCPPHNKKSRFVTPADLPRVLVDAKDLVALCTLPRGNYSGIMALAHSQIDDVDPLRFFVLPKGKVIINPVITYHSDTVIFKDEACMSYPYTPTKMNVPRFNRITVTYQNLVTTAENTDPVLSKPVTEEMKGGTAHVFQHEVSHLNGWNIYDDGFTAESIEWLGGGTMTEEDVQKLYE